MQDLGAARGVRLLSLSTRKSAACSSWHIGRWHGLRSSPTSLHLAKAAEAASCNSTSSRLGSAQISQGGASFSIQETAKRDWWMVSELHCRSFYPTASCVAAVLLRFDRVESLKLGFERGRRPGPGNFACYMACLDDPDSQKRTPSTRIPSIFRIFAKAKEGFGRHPEDGGLVGTVIVDTLGEHVPPRKRKGRQELRKGMAYLSNLAVDTQFRRQGIGRQLLDHAIQAARGWGCRAIVLHCDPRNKAARQMYRQAGFRRVADEPPLVQLLEARPGIRLELMVKRLRT